MLIDLPVEDARAAMITVDAGGRAWAALNGAGALARAEGQTLRLVELPGGRAPVAPVGVVAAADGVWYADIAGGAAGRQEPHGLWVTAGAVWVAMESGSLVAVEHL